MDPVTCCLLGICCPPASEEQFNALVKVLSDQFQDEARGRAIATQVRGALVVFTRKLAKAAKAT